MNTSSHLSPPSPATSVPSSKPSSPPTPPNVLPSSTSPTTPGSPTVSSPAPSPTPPAKSSPTSPTSHAPPRARISPGSGKLPCSTRTNRRPSHFPVQCGVNRALARCSISTVKAMAAVDDLPHRLRPNNNSRLSRCRPPSPNKKRNSKKPCSQAHPSPLSFPPRVNLYSSRPLTHHSVRLRCSGSCRLQRCSISGSGRIRLDGRRGYRGLERRRRRMGWRV